MVVMRLSEKREYNSDPVSEDSHPRCLEKRVGGRGVADCQEGNQDLIEAQDPEGGLWGSFFSWV